MTAFTSINQAPQRVEAPQPYGFGGTGSITGTVAVYATPTNTPVARRVRLHHADTGLVVREVWSTTAGAYSFTKLAVGTYYVTAFDHTGTYTAVVQDALTVTEG